MKEISDFSTSVMCRNLKFLHMTDFFSTGTARDKYQVCPKLSRMTHTWESLTHRDLNRLDWVPKIRKPAPLALLTYALCNDESKVRF